MKVLWGLQILETPLMFLLPKAHLKVSMSSIIDRVLTKLSRKAISGQKEYNIHDCYAPLCSQMGSIRFWFCPESSENVRSSEWVRA